MSGVFLIGLGISILVMIGVDILVAYKAYHRGDRSGYTLAATAFFTAVVSMAYCFSILADDYFRYSIYSSIYFAFIDWMLFGLIMFVYNHDNHRINRKFRYLMYVFFAYMCFDTLALFVNPFYELVISYVPRDTVVSKFGYDMHLLYHLHLIFSYVMVGAILACFIYRIATAPSEYRRQYTYSLGGIALVVGVNAVFLFTPGLKLYNFLDYSVWFYSPVVYILYWSCFRYATHGMLNYFKNSIFESVDQGIVMFDRDDRMVLFNSASQKLLPNVTMKELLPLDDFLQGCSISPLQNFAMDTYAFQCYQKEEGKIKPLRCEYRVMKDKRGRLKGKLFTFSNAMLETDLLTGYHNIEAFEILANEVDPNQCRLSVSVCDINGLSFINASQGHYAGDHCIKELADTLRKNFPQGAFFVRGRDATLVVICFELSEEETKEYLQKACDEVNIDVEYAVCMSDSGPAILEAIEHASRALRQKKLMDVNSSHSSSLKSLVRAMQECDPDTEAHVKRTQKMGAALGRRMGLTDVQHSDLSLLCLLHDIGKIGIPLEILNKPSKLSGEEWVVMQSHVEKGFQIANSSPDLKNIAKMIRHHHERWDGHGYPDGLSRESIPLLSRVIGVVDAYDAMVSNRCYRKALSQEAAFEELRRCAGSQFDPAIVSEFIQMLKEHPNMGVSEFDGTAEELPNSLQTKLVTETGPQNVHPVKYMNYVLDANSLKFVSVNKAFEEISGYTQEEVLEKGMSQIDFLPEEDRAEYLGKLGQLLSKSTEAYVEHRFVCKSGKVIYVLCVGRQRYDSAAKALRVEVFVVDVGCTYAMKQVTSKEQARAAKRLKQWEDTFRRDSLTGLLCHSAFHNDVEEKLLENRYKVMLLMLDVDKFKEYNDTYGHRAGDEFLILVGQTLSSSLRRDDLSCRMGGDEFAAALFFKKECTDEFMYMRAQQIFDKINMSLSTATTGTTLSMGAVISNEELNSFNKMYESSDKALYRSKEGGRSRLSVG